MGDLETLLERIERLQGVKEFEKTMEEMLAGKITFRTIYKQLEQMRKLGPFKKVPQMIPGVSSMMQSFDEAAKVSEEKMKKWMSIMNSMTYEELDNPSLLEERSRVKRIAIGAGVETSDVRELYSYYKTVRRMIRQLKKRKDILEKFSKMGKLPGA
jgi:signal recognition particle subunit SRP54